MHSGAAVFPTVIGILAMVFIGLMFVATIVGSVLFFAGRPRSGVRRVGGSLAFVCGTMLGIVLALGVALIGLKSVRMGVQDLPATVQHQPQLGRASEELPSVDSVREEVRRPANPDAGLTRLPEDGNVTVPVDGLKPLTGHDDRTSATAGKLPAWTERADVKTGDVTHKVLSSKQYSTIEEARTELAVAARTLLTQDFEKNYGQRAQGLNVLPAETLRTLAVRQEYVETVDRDFGNFFAPMHRVWWQLELSPVVRSELHPLWKAQVQEARVLTVGGGLLAITVALAGLSLFTRRRSAVMGS